MSPESIVAIIGGFIALSSIIGVIARKAPKKINKVKYVIKWRDLQKLCAHSETWSDAILKADSLLDEVLKKRRKTGSSMGERLVEAQHTFTNNDAVWVSHKLANNIRKYGDDKKLNEKNVKDSLIAYRQALRDLGALK